MAEKILGLLSAAVLGGIVFFYVIVKCVGTAIREAPSVRRQIIEYCMRYEPQCMSLPLDPERVAALENGYSLGLEHVDAVAGVEEGMRVASGRCRCGAQK